ncbi:MAG: LysE family translocator [Rikenellaceae bacterium]
MINAPLSFLIFFFVTSITPGPNNITSLTFTLHQGYRNTLPYMLGIISGVFLVFFSMAMLLLFAASTSISQALYWMRYIGAAYILYLAYRSFMMNINWDNKQSRQPHFFDGFIFQAINPKLYFFSTTVLTSFVNYDQASLTGLTLLATAVATVTFICVSIWGVTGAFLRVALENQLYKRIFGCLLALSLIYTAISILMV